jgi:hypothetical protein
VFFPCSTSAELSLNSDQACSISHPLAATVAGKNVTTTKSLIWVRNLLDVEAYIPSNQYYLLALQSTIYVKTWLSLCRKNSRN